jgi:hypothetical protein
MKDRVPPAVLASLKGLPALMIVVTTTVFVSPEAWARIQEGRGEPVLVGGEDGGVMTKRYTKEELSQKMPANPIVGIDQRLVQEVSGVLNRMARGFSASDTQESMEKLKTKMPTDTEAGLRLSALSDVPETRKANGVKLRTFMTSESQKAASAQAKSKVDIVNRLGNGFGFGLNFGQMFGSSKKGGEETAQRGTVRYGLIIKDIVPDENAPKRAAIADSGEEYELAGHAEVEWTIGPIDEAQGRKLFPAQGEESGGKNSFFGLKIPSANFKGNVQPENAENLAQVGKGALPNLKVDVSQEEDLYKMTYRTKMDGERISLEHEFKMPVAGTIALGRRFTDSWDVIQTSAYNILYDKRLPLLSVHQMNIEQRYKADLAKTYGSHTIAVEMRGEAKGEVADEADRPRAYSLNYTTKF